MVGGNQENPFLNNGRLELHESDGLEINSTVLVECFKMATPKGWESAKKIYEPLDVILWEQSNGALITEECAKMLAAKYANVQVKVYETAEQRAQRANAAGWNYVAANFMHDPYCTR